MRFVDSEVHPDYRDMILAAFPEWGKEDFISGFKNDVDVVKKDRHVLRLVNFKKGEGIEVDSPDLAGVAEKEITVPSLRALFRGNGRFQDNGSGYPPDECNLFLFQVERNVIRLVDTALDNNIPTDNEFMEAYSSLARRPDGRFNSLLTDAIWQIATYLAICFPISEQEFTYSMRRLEHSARNWRTGVASRNYFSFVEGMLHKDNDNGIADANYEEDEDDFDDEEAYDDEEEEDKLLDSVFDPGDKDENGEEDIRTYKLQVTYSVYAVPGVECEVYFNNLFQPLPSDKLTVVFDCDEGKVESDRWSWVPGDSDVGCHPFHAALVDEKREEVEWFDGSVIVSSRDAGKGRELNILRIGGDMTADPGSGQALKRLFQRPGNPTVHFLGTQNRNPSDPQDDSGVCEARPGWTFTDAFSPPPLLKDAELSPFCLKKGKGSAHPRLSLPAYFDRCCQGQTPDFILVELDSADGYAPFFEEMRRNVFPDDEDAMCRLDRFFVPMCLLVE
ncbi:MAG: hypothetical protein IJJ33_05900, partial [Victivallales bacterium]|nr:hypothetical protein [Victivallales bacterium]